MHSSKTYAEDSWVPQKNMPSVKTSCIYLENKNTTCQCHINILIGIAFSAPSVSIFFDIDIPMRSDIILSILLKKFFFFLRRFQKYAMVHYVFIYDVDIIDTR